MYLNSETAGHLVETAVSAISSHPESFCDVLDQLPAAIYVTDTAGTVTYYNKACVELAGRTPEPGNDKWCVTWKLFSSVGEYMPHDECPMAVAIREQREIRNVEAIAERPDGTRVNFIPFPTPFFDEAGNMAGAVNLLLDITSQRGSDYLRDQAEKCRRLAASVTDRGVMETLNLMAAKYDEQAFKNARRTCDAASD